MTALLAASLVSFGLAALFVRLLAGAKLSQWILDQPNERSLHEKPIPRTGGLGLFAAAGLGWLLLAKGGMLVPVLLAGALMLPSILDDIMHLPITARFGVQIPAALALLLVAGVPWLLLPILLLAVLWMTNLYNFMDGSDGLAGGMAVIGFGTYALAATAADAPDIALTSAVLAAAAGGFLIWNSSPAIIFLGDAGSIPLGFLAAALGIAGWQRGLWPLAFPVLVFGPFVADATLTLLRRLLRGENVVKAHREHTYQKLIRSGWSHGQTARGAYLLMAAGALLALTLRTADELTAVLGVGAALAILAITFLLIERRIGPLTADRVQG